MNASRPEADIEYSRAPGASRGRLETAERGFSPLPAPLFIAILAGSLLLVVAEFTPLLRVHSGAYHAGVVQTISAGSHHSYALLPVALLAAGLAAVARVSGNRLALASIAVLGLVALGIALFGDLPDAHATGLLRQGGSYVAATSSVAIGFYLETLGAVVLLVSAAAALVWAGGRREGDRHTTIVRRRSAS
jgi:hypothetical protein